MQHTKKTPAIGSTYWHLVDPVTPFNAGSETVLAKYWVGDQIDKDRLWLGNVFNSRAEAESEANRV